MKVTFCSYDSPSTLGGPFVWLERLLPALRKQGIECRCLFMLHDGNTGPTLSALKLQGFDCEVTSSGETEDRVRWILGRLRENPPDIFVPNLVVAGYFAGRWVRAANIPTVGILHSDDPYYRGFQNEFVFGKKENKLSALVCVSRELKRQVLFEKLKGIIVRRIPCGVPIPDKAIEGPAKTMRLIFSGRLAEEQKRISEVARAFCCVVKQVSGTEAIIYGDGPDRSNVEKILEKEGKGLPVELAGRIDANKIQQKMFEGDVFVLLSDYEGVPVALMEAMACGCVPVCLRMRSGIPELIEDGVTGLLVSDRGDSVVAAIRRLRDYPELWKKLSRAARAKIEAEYSEKICVQKWFELFKELNSKAGVKRDIVVPKKINLPPPNPVLESVCNRPVLPPMPIRIYRRTRIFLGRIKRRLVGIIQAKEKDGWS